VEKEWSPAKHEGSVEYVNSIDQVDMSEGTWLLLARNVYLLKQFNDHCLSSGLVFSSHLGSPMSGATLRAIKSWEMLRREEPITKAAAMEVYDHMSSRRGVSHGGKSSLERVPENQEITVEYLRLHHGLLVNSIWHEALDKIPPQECEYFLAALRRGEKLLKEPRIRIETIHGVKGGEADSIVVCTDMADRTWREYEQSPDDEHRVWYVAVTRARRRLFIMSPQTNMSYVI
jgi:hypothetical protein